MKNPDRHAISTALQPRGAVLAGTGLALLMAGMWRVDGTLASLGLAAWALLALAWIMARRNLAGLELKLEAPASVRAGTVFPLTLTLQNRRRWLDAFSIRIEVRLAGQIGSTGRAAWVAARSAADLELRLALPARGSARDHPARLASRFPLGLFETETRSESQHPMLILPKPARPGDLGFPGDRVDAADTEGAATGEALGELRSLRAWRAGDSPRRIVWPATLRSMARGAAMVVRESDPPGFHPDICSVVFHSFGPDGGLIQPERFERAISLAAGTLRQLVSHGIRVHWTADFLGWESQIIRNRRQLGACIEQLAAAQRATTTEAHDLQNALARIPPDHGLVVLSDMPAATWSRALPDRPSPALTPEIARRTRRLEVSR